MHAKLISASHRLLRGSFVLAAAALLIGCAEDEPEQDPIPEAVSVEPHDEVGATGGVALPGNVTIDSAAVAPDTTVPGDTTPPAG
ncbi:MAG TPA: hypothetical protein VFI91_11270 [Longimicrobiaceae bacterium]|nr:hypothetical protein [Longimicrobiaceae bacterium]